VFEEPLPGCEVAWDYISCQWLYRYTMLHVGLRRMSFCKLLKGMFTVRDGLDWIHDEGDIWEHAVILQQTCTYIAIYTIATHAWCRI